MVIECETIKELVEICAGLVERGIMFEACTLSLKVICTGGY